MTDKEAIELTNQAFRLGIQMRDAILGDDNEERRNIRTEWALFHRENSHHHADLFLAYRRGLESIPARA